MWASFRNGPTNFGNTKVPFKQNVSLKTLKTYVGGIVWGTCVIDHKNALYVGSSNGLFFKIVDGMIVWKYSLKLKSDSLIDSAAAIHPLGFVIVGGGDGFIHALHMETGKALWVLQAPHSVDDRSGAIVNSFEGNIQIDPSTGIIYAGCDNGYFYAIDPSGKPIWSYKTDMMIWSCAAISNDIICFGSLDKHFYILNKFNGKLVAKHNVGSEIKSSPLIVDDCIYICNSNGQVCCFKNNEMLFRKDYGKEIYSSLAYKDGKFVLATFDGKISALKKNGDIIWTWNTYNNICCSPIISGDNFVIIGDEKGIIYFIDVYTGKLEYMFQAGSSNINASPAMDQIGVVHVGSYDGHIYHISIQQCKTIQNYVPKFLTNPTPHLELTFNGSFVKQYKVRVFDKDGKYIPNAAIKHATYEGTGSMIVSSDGRFLNIIGQNIKGSITCKCYKQTDNWFYDRMVLSSPFQIQQNVFQTTIIDKKDVLKNYVLAVWDVFDLKSLQPKILDTYIPAALNAVTFKSIAIVRNEKEISFLCLPTVRDHMSGKFTVLKEPSKVFLLNGTYDKNIIKLHGKFVISSMGGTIPFTKFETYMKINPDTNNLEGEFIGTTSCFNIKGNNSTYKFSSELINQLCNPYMKLISIGTMFGRLSSISQSSYDINFKNGNIYIPENKLVTVVYLDGDEFKYLCYTQGGVVSVKAYKLFYVFIDDEYCFSYKQ